MFRNLRIKDIRKETNDAVSISFEVPHIFLSEFKYKSGQFITVKKSINGEDVRRAYSLSSAPHEKEWRIGVKNIPNGKMSTYLNKELKKDQDLEIMFPMGNFSVNNLNGLALGFAAGSGITPIFSIAKTILNSGGVFVLFYGNKTSEDVIFKKQIDGLQKKFGDKFQAHFIYSRENCGDNFYNGRIDKNKSIELFKKYPKFLKADDFYLCGPEEMIKNVVSTIEENGVEKERVHYELFKASELDGKSANSKKIENDFTGDSKVKVLVDGDEIDFDLNVKGDYILDAAMNQGADAPFSCKGAVCCTCKALVVKGQAIMDINYALSDAEIEQGFVLTKVARPASEKGVVDFDVI